MVIEVSAKSFGSDEIKLNGYRASHRNKWRLIQHGILNVQELALLEFYADIFDFDKRHIKYGLFEVDFDEFAVIFNCKSPNTVRNWHKRLLRLGFIEKAGKRGVYRLKTSDRYISPGVWEGKAPEYAEREKDQPIAAILQNLGVSPQLIGGKTQLVGDSAAKRIELRGKSSDRAIDSSKDESKVDGNYQLLTLEDMRWIDENVIESAMINIEKSDEFN